MLGWFRGCLNMAMMAVNTVVWCSLIYVGTLLKLVLPLKRWREMWGRVLNRLADGWIWSNNLGWKITLPTRWSVEGLPSLDPREWYIVIANHQSWADILILQKIFHRKIPLLKFFIKQQLLYVPFLGWAWWALDFPFMKRYSKKAIAKRPQLKNKDMETARKACGKFKLRPVSIMNFVEGTRFSRHKKQNVNSPYENLLPPKAGGLALVMSNMGEQLAGILDVTIVYKDGVRGLWGFVSGKIREVKVSVRKLPLQTNLVGDYGRDSEFRQQVQSWINHVWQDKDLLISEISTPTPSP